MEKIMICVRCQKEVKPKENYIQICEWENKKLLKQNFVHKSCWDLFVEEKNTKTAALGMLKKVMGKLNDTGILVEDGR